MATPVDVQVNATPKADPKLDVTFTTNIKPGTCAVDIGTMWIVASRPDTTGKISIKKIRDCYFEIGKESKNLLNMSKDAQYVEFENRLYTLGNFSVRLGNMFGKEVMRPLSKGVINPKDVVEARKILFALLKEVLGQAPTKNEPCCYSIPGNPVDNPEKNVVYHSAVFKQILEQLGYKPIPVNEALAVCYAECANDDYSGLTFSFGSGMTNVSLVYKTLCGVQFSIEKGGDWLDQNVAIAFGKTPSQMCMLKEEGLDLSDYKKGDSQYELFREAYVAYYKAMITTVLEQVLAQFAKKATDFIIPEEIPVVISGGTALPAGFLEFFKSQFEPFRKTFPVKIGEIRLAKNMLDSVSLGLLAYSQAVN